MNSNFDTFIDLLDDLCDAYGVYFDLRNTADGTEIAIVSDADANVFQFL